MDAKTRLRFVADTYIAGLKRGDLSDVPWHHLIQFRTPLVSAGCDVPLEGKAALLDYFAGVYGALQEVRVIDYLFNDSLTAICVRFDVALRTGKRLRTADIFRLNADGDVAELENHYDPRPALK